MILYEYYLIKVAISQEPEMMLTAGINEEAIRKRLSGK